MLTPVENRQHHAACQRRIRGLRAWHDQRGAIGGLAVLFLPPALLRDPLVREYIELVHIHFDLCGPDSLMHSQLPR